MFGYDFMSVWIPNTDMDKKETCIVTYSEDLNIAGDQIK